MHYIVWQTVIYEIANTDKLWYLIKEVRTEVDFADGGFGVRPDVVVTFLNANIILIDITVVNPDVAPAAAALTYANLASARNNFTLLLKEMR